MFSWNVEYAKQVTPDITQTLLNGGTCTVNCANMTTWAEL